MTADKLKEELKRLAPDVAFTVATTPDPNFRWDGDGPDPEEDGFTPSDVDVSAIIIVNGTLEVETASMGGHYVKDDEPDPDLGGYLPQMLKEAADNLAKRFPKHAQLNTVSDFLYREMRQRYIDENPGWTM